MKKDAFLGLSSEGFHRVAYTEWGNTSSQSPILCVHGLTRQGRDFDALAHFLAEKHYHLYCPDMVGRGDSDWLKNPLHYTYEQYLSDMTALLARTGAKEVDWIGTSMGGIIGMVMASFSNSPIKRLVLNDIGPLVPIKGLSRLAQYTGYDPVFKNEEEAKNYFKTIYKEFGPLTEDQWLALTIHSIKKTPEGQFISKLDPGVKLSPTKSRLAWQLLLNPRKALQGTMFDVDLWDIWYKVKCPVLLIHGEQSDLLSFQTIESMRKSHANLEVIHVPNTGHAPALQEPHLHESIYQWLVKTA